MKNSPLTELPKSAFYKSKCKTINFPRTITTIPEKAFQWSDINILSQSSITRIEGAAFYGSKVRAFTFTNVTYIGDNAFNGCTSLEAPNMYNITYIGGSAFEDCSNLKKVALPQCLETVKEHAFEDCFLTSLSLYNTVNTFENSGDLMALGIGAFGFLTRWSFFSF